MIYLPLSTGSKPPSKTAAS
jgi:hypothetical protein